MIKNYLRSAIRNIKRHPFISFINIFGLTVGLTCCLLIVAYVISERSYDRYNKNADDIYRVTRTFYTTQGVANLHLSAVAPPFGPLLQNAFPETSAIAEALPVYVSTWQDNSRIFSWHRFKKVKKMLEGIDEVMFQIISNICSFYQLEDPSLWVHHNAPLYLSP
jgi:putative ABC transport system permease protein